MSIILHIARRRDWEEASSRGYYAPTSLANEGFVHCSTVEQTVDTANAFFRGMTDLVLLCVDVELLEPEVRYEPPVAESGQDSRGDQLFPHAYGALNIESIVRVVGFAPRTDGTFQLPPEIARLAGETNRRSTYG